jgi:hypothetical protein
VADADELARAVVLSFSLLRRRKKQSPLDCDLSTPEMQNSLGSIGMATRVQPACEAGAASARNRRY